MAAAVIAAHLLPPTCAALTLQELRCASDARAPLRSVDTIKRDVGDLAAFLVSDSSRSITGQNIAVDCGVGLLT